MQNACVDSFPAPFWISRPDHHRCLFRFSCWKTSLRQKECPAHSHRSRQHQSHDSCATICRSERKEKVLLETCAEFPERRIRTRKQQAVERPDQSAPAMAACCLGSTRFEMGTRRRTRTKSMDQPDSTALVSISPVVFRLPEICNCG